MDMETLEAIDKAKRAIGPDYSELLPFMAPPTPTEHRRTAPEVAYRAMGEAIDGLKPAELRELAQVISHWKRCSRYRRRIIGNVAATLSTEQYHADREKEYEAWLDVNHPIIDFKKAQSAH